MTVTNIRNKRAKWKKKCWLRHSDSISSFENSVCITSVHPFWVAEINRGDLVLLQHSTWLTCFIEWLICSEHLHKTVWESKKVKELLDIPLKHHLSWREKKNRKTGNALSLYFATAQQYMQKIVLTFPVILLTSPMFSANAALPPVIHSCSGTLTFPAGLLNQDFLHPNSQFGFMIKKNI